MTVTDDLGRKMDIPANPVRVISLVPSITETVAVIGKEDVLAGVTRFCIHPPQIRKKVAVVGGTKNLDAGLIRKIQPGLILSEKSENNKKQILDIANEFPVYVFDITNFDAGLRLIEVCGKLFSAPAAFRLINKIKQSFAKMEAVEPLKKAVYLIWKKPWMAAGKNTFIGSMMQKAGFESVVRKDYPVIDDEIINKADVIMLSSEPYPFTERDVGKLREKFRNKTVMLVDGEMFAWYGARMLKAAEYFLTLNPKRT
jgi:ABC-type Fe3+-hydroxamate transport system substrate-binding protein